MTNSRLDYLLFKKWYINSGVVSLLLPSALGSGMVSLLLSRLLPVAIHAGMLDISENNEFWLLLWTILLPVVFLIMQLRTKK